MTFAPMRGVLLILVTGCNAPVAIAQKGESEHSGAARTRPATSRPDPDLDLEPVRTVLRQASEQRKAGNHEAARAGILAAWKATSELPDAETRKAVQDLRFEIGRVAFEAGYLRAAQLAWERVNEFRERTLSGDDRELQRVRLSLATTKKALGDFAAALALEEKVFAVFSRTLADDDRDLQAARLNLAATKTGLGDLHGALALEEKVFAVFSRTLADDHYDLQAARLNLGFTKGKLGDLQGALALAEKVFEVFSRTLRDDHPDLQRARVNLAATRLELGDLRGAQALYQKVYEVRSRTLPDDNPDLQAARGNLATIQRALGDLEGASQRQERVLEVLSRTLPDHHDHLQWARANLAMTKHELGDLLGAFLLEEKVLEIRARTLSEDHADLLAAQLNLAATKEALGDLRGALALFEKVLTVLSRTRPDGHPDLQRARGNLAATKWQLGDLEGALALEQAVVEVWSRIRADDDHELQKARSNLAGTKAGLGDHQGARVLLENVVDVLSRTFPAGHSDLQVARSNLANTKHALGDVEGARVLHEQVFDAFSRTLPDDHPILQRARGNLSATQHAAGDLRGALALAETAFGILARTLPDDHADLQAASQNLAHCLVDLGDATTAQKLLNDALHDADRRLGFVAVTMSPRAHQQAIRGISGLLSSILSLKDTLAEPQTSSAKELSMLLRFRGLVGREARHRAALQRAAERDDQLRKLISAARQADLTFHRALSSTEPEARGKLPALREAMESGQERVVRTAAQLPAFARDADWPDISALAQHLAKNAVAIMTASYTRRLPWDEDLKRHPDPIPSVAAFVLRPDGSVQRVELGESARIARLCAECVRSSSARVRARGKAVPQSASTRDPAGELAEVLAPLLALLPESTQTVYLAPEGPLASIPWEILPVQGRPLRDKVSIRYVDTLAALLPTPGLGGEPSLLVLGGIDYGGEPGVAASRPSAPDLFTVRGGGTFGSLPGSRREAEAIHRLFAETFPKQTARLLTDREACKASFVALAENHRVLHLATHAFVADDKDWELGQKERGVSARTDAGPLQSNFAGYARGLLSGIVFAGANRRLDGSKDDAVLTAAELSLLDLSRCDLAVLSACETNVGPRYAGEAVTGLNRALQLAGVRHTITSLWKVDDDGAAAFFRAFYEHLWKRKLSVPAAFEAAREEVIRAGFGPGVWAGFVLYVTGQEVT